MKIISRISRPIVVNIGNNSFSRILFYVIRRTISFPIQIKKRYFLSTKLPARIKETNAYLTLDPERKINGIKENTLAYINTNHKPEVNVGAYSYKSGGLPILYASCYAALTRHLYNDLSDMSVSCRREWAKYIMSFQSADGLFRDPVIDCPLAREIDWWGWRHLTLHCLMALTALDSQAKQSFELTKKFMKKGFISSWLETRNWKFDPASVSNEIQNVGVMLQYSRDYFMEKWCDDVLQEMYDWLDEKKDPKTGLWGSRFDSPILLSQGVQTGYHIWLLYFYDKRAISNIENTLDSCLASQNAYGGFGVPLNSSACEDIDSIDPIVRFSFLTDYRKQDIRNALEKARSWILVNFNADGGWVFRRNESFQYGHRLMRANSEESSMFPTWFRTLSLAYIGKVLASSPWESLPWAFVDSPGHQFWKI